MSETLCTCASPEAFSRVSRIREDTPHWSAPRGSVT
jgi:hypothetical protein